MAYTIRVYSNSHYLDESESYLLKESFSQYTDALAAAKAIVESCISGFIPKGGALSRQELTTFYKTFGEDPAILSGPGDEAGSFSAWSYAEEYIKALTETLEKEQKTELVRFASVSYHDNARQFVTECAYFVQKVIQRFCPAFSVDIGEITWKFGDVIRGYYDYSINTATTTFVNPNNGDEMEIEIWHDWNFEEENSVRVSIKTGLMPAIYRIGLASDQLDGWGYFWGKMLAEDWKKVEGRK